MLSINGSIEVKGEIIIEHNVKFAFLTKDKPVISIIGNGIATAADERLIDTKISFKAVLSGKFKLSFKFDPFQTSIEGKLEVEFKGAAGVKLKYGVNEKRGLFVSQILYCSGIEGSYYGELKARNDFLGSLFETSTNDGKPVKFNLVEPFEVPLYTVQLFNQPEK